MKGGGHPKRWQANHAVLGDARMEVTAYSRVWLCPAYFQPCDHRVGDLKMAILWLPARAQRLQMVGFSLTVPSLEQSFFATGTPFDRSSRDRAHAELDYLLYIAWICNVCQ
jgi:hypothetical protein